MKLYEGNNIFTLGVIYVYFWMIGKKEVERKILILLERWILYDGRVILREMGKGGKVREVKEWGCFLF